MITIYTLCYNEDFMLPHFIKHYRSSFPGCHIVVYDNMSTDNTKQIALDAGCEVRGYDTGGKLDDMVYLQIKNNCWKDAATDWVMVVDCDEFCQINAINLKNEIRRGTSLIRFTGYNMVNMQDNMNIEAITHAVRAKSYDKPAMFNKAQITAINYSPGAHNAAPHGYAQDNQAIYELHHYKYLNPDYMVRRHAAFAKRLSAVNLKHGYGGHYQFTEAHIRAEFEEARKQAIKIL